MKSLGQIQRDNDEAAALAHHPRVGELIVDWLKDMGDNTDPGDMYGRALAEVLAQWQLNSPNSTPTFRELMAKVAYAADVELGDV